MSVAATPTRIHPTAVIDPRAELDLSVEVGPYAVIGESVTIGEGTTIGAHVVLQGPLRIGARNRIHAFACLGQVSQDKSAKYEDDTAVEIGDDNIIREYVTIERGTLKDARTTRVGHDNWIMARVHIGHDSQVGSHTVFVNNVALAGHIVVEDYVGLGGFTLIHQFCRIGAYAFTGGGSVLTRDVPPYVMMQGHPAEPRGINTEGLRRAGFSSEDIEAIKDAYKLVYLSGQLMSEVKKQLAKMGRKSPPVQRMLEFIESSKRSIQR